MTCAEDGFGNKSFLVVNGIVGSGVTTVLLCGFQCINRSDELKLTLRLTSTMLRESLQLSFKFLDGGLGFSLRVDRSLVVLFSSGNVVCLRNFCFCRFCLSDSGLLCSFGYSLEEWKRVGRCVFIFLRIEVFAFFTINGIYVVGVFLDNACAFSLLTEGILSGLGSSLLFKDVVDQCLLIGDSCVGSYFVCNINKFTDVFC